MSQPVSLHLPDDLVLQLDAVAAAQDRSRSSLARRLLQAGLAAETVLKAAQVGPKSNGMSQLDPARLREDHLEEHSRLSRRMVEDANDA